MTKAEIILLRKLESVFRLPREVMKHIIRMLFLRVRQEVPVMRFLGFRDWEDVQIRIDPRLPGSMRFMTTFFPQHVERMLFNTRYRLPRSESLREEMEREWGLSTGVYNMPDTTR